MALCVGCRTLPAQPTHAYCRPCSKGTVGARCNCGLALDRGCCAHCDDAQVHGCCAECRATQAAIKRLMQGQELEDARERGHLRQAGV